MAQLAQVVGSFSYICGDAHAGQLFIGDLVRTCRSRSQYSHM